MDQLIPMWLKIYVSIIILLIISAMPVTFSSSVWAEKYRLIALYLALTLGALMLLAFVWGF